MYKASLLHSFHPQFTHDSATAGEKKVKIIAVHVEKKDRWGWIVVLNI